MTRSQSGSIPRAIASLATILFGLALLVGQIPASGTIPSPSQSQKSTSASRTNSQQVTAQQRAAVDQAYGKLPLAFEANAGQSDSSVAFLAHGTGYTLALGAQAVTLSLRGSAAAHASAKSGDAASLVSRLGAPGPQAQIGAASLSMRWVGGNAQPQISGENALPGTVNYFVGNDPSKWRTNVATYAQVRYANVYPGIDLVYYGSQGGQLEYDVVVQPGADPTRFQLAYDGSQGMRLDAQGNLQLRLANGQTLAQQAPRIYQMIDGKQQSVAGEYRLGANGQVGFALGAYDHALPLIIDPLFRYGTYLGGSSGDAGDAITIDTVGNAYITGNTDSSDFPTTGGAFQTTAPGNGDAFVTKLNANGTALIYSTYLGGSTGSDSGNGIAVDGGGNAYIVGVTSSTNFPVTIGAFQTTYQGGLHDAFVTKLNAAGSSLVYSTYLGGSLDDQARGMTLDSSGNVYVTGYTTSTNFPLHNAMQGSLGGGTDAFATKLNAAGTTLTYSTYLGGSSTDQGNGIALDGGGAAYITGYTNSSNFPLTNPFDNSLGGTQDAFVTKLSASGSSRVYSTYLGGSGEDFGAGIVVDGSGNAYVTGLTASTNFPVVIGAFQGSNLSTASGTGFVTKLNAAGNALVASTYLGGSYFDEPEAITIDGAGYAYVTGLTLSSDFPTANPLQASLAGEINVFIARLTPNLGSLVFGTYLGGSGLDLAFGLALGPASTLYVTGFTESVDFPHPNAFQPFYAGSSDAFVAKIKVLPTPGDTVGAYLPSNGTFYLHNANSTGYADLTVPFGPANCQPLIGDWNGKGYDSIGVYCNGVFYLKNANSPGPADLVFGFGPASGCSPLAGDWTGKNYDSVGVFCSGVFYLKNSNTPGLADITIVYGAAGMTPLAGDWNGKGYDSIGVYYPPAGAFLLRNANSAGPPSISAYFGAPGDQGVMGNWVGKGYQTLGVTRGGVFYLRNANTSGYSDSSLAFGTSAMVPLSGQWAPILGSIAAHRNPAKHPTGPLPTIPTR